MARLNNHYDFLWFKVEDDDKDDKCVHRLWVFLFLNKRIFKNIRLSYVAYQLNIFLIKKWKKDLCVYILKDKRFNWMRKKYKGFKCYK